MAPPIDPELLLRENAWLRRLARSLVADPEAADDLVQDTWVAALEHPPPSFGDGARAWLVAVAQNLVRTGGRRRANALARERSVARREALPSVGESVERVAAQRELVDAVLALEPLERDIVVLRYFEGLPPRAIAARLGLSGPAVRSRLSRALAELRARLDRRFEGGRKAWAALLVPSGGPRPAAGGPTLVPWLAALGAGAAAVVTTWLVLAREPEREEGHTNLVAAQEPASSAGLREAAAEPPRRAPEPVPAPQRIALEAEPAGPALASTASAWTLVAHFVDVDDAPLAGVRLVHSDRGTEWSGASDSAGALRIELAWPYTGRTVGAGEVWVEARGRTLATQAWHLEVRGPGEQSLGEIRMQPGGSMAGRIVDAGGQPFSGAYVRATGGAPETPLGLDEARTMGTNVRWLGERLVVQARSGADGRFLLEGVPATDVAALAASYGFLSGIGPLTFVAPAATVDVGDVVLARPGPENLIAGTVLDERGAPVAGVRIEYGEQDPRRDEGRRGATDASGRFALIVPRERRYSLVFSRDDRGRNPLVLSDVPAGTSDLEVRLAGERWIELVAQDEHQSVVPIHALQVWDTDGVWLRAASEALPDGRQRLCVPSVRFQIQIVTPGWKNQFQGPYDPATVPEHIVFPVVRAAGMAGRVLANDAPVAGARVHAHPEREAGSCGISDDGFHARVTPFPFGETETDAEGRFRIPGDSSGIVTLHAELDGWARAELGPFEFVDGVEETGLDLVLERGGTIEGRLLVAEGVEPRGKVVGVGCGESHVPTQELGPDGTYRFEHLRPGEYQVLTCNPEYLDRLESGTHLWADPADPVEWSTTVRAGEVTRFDLDQRDRIPSRLQGTLRFDGRVAPGWSCGLFNRFDDPAFATLDPRGRFDCRVARPGAFSIHLNNRSGPARVLMYGKIELAPGDNSWARDLPTGTVTLAGLPAFERTSEGEQEAPAFALRWRDDPELTWTAALHEPPEAGTLTLPLVPAGRVELLRRPDGKRRGSPDDDWPIVLALDLVAGEHAHATVP